MYPREGETGYEVKLALFGLLSLDDEDPGTPEDTRRYVASLNGATILYGIARAEVASLTSNFPGGRLLLPTVYMDEVLKQQAARLAEGKADSAQP
jgi:hypothetical protein